MNEEISIEVTGFKRYFGPVYRYANREVCSISIRSGFMDFNNFQGNINDLQDSS